MREVVAVYVEVVVCVQLPELAVHHVKVLVAEVLQDLRRCDHGDGGKIHAWMQYVTWN